MEEVQQKPDVLLSADGCVNQSKIGGVCIRHGAKIKQCTSREGCTNQDQE